MSDRLPENPADWPADPHEVLGVPRGVPPRELRKAYTAMIRTFKPEHHPEQFRRIREAYEYLQRFAGFYTPSEEATPADEPVVEPPPAPEAEGPDVEAIWRAAIDGQAENSFREFVSLLDRWPKREDLYARLYWLAVLFPEAVGETPAAEWLIRGITSGGGGRLLESLYASEIANDPYEAASERFTRLMDHASSPEQLAARLRQRWEPLFELQHLSVIERDFRDRHERIRQINEMEYLNLLVDLLGRLPWMRHSYSDRGFETLLVEEVKKLEPSAINHSYYFDQFEYQQAMIEQWNALARLTAPSDEFLPLIRDGWSGSFERIRFRLETILRLINEEPSSWLNWFDRADHYGRLVLVQFDQMLNRYRLELSIDDQPLLEPEEIRKSAMAILRPHSSSYSKLRERALAYLLDENLGPELVAEAFSSYAGGPEQLPNWVAWLHNDLPMSILCRAVRLIRS